jgi:cytochrome c biogenesis protein CcmG/thiol:disulfide interchange protein DsbE
MKSVDWSKRGSWNSLILIWVVIGIGWIVLSRVPQGEDEKGSIEQALPQVGYLAPALEGVTLSGSPIRLDDVQGKVVLINFWATWCPPCRLEMPAMQALYAHYYDQGFEILAVNLQEQDDQMSVFVNEMGLTFPVIVDRTGDLSSAYRVTSLPTTFIVDREGIIRDRIVGGPLAEALLESKITPLLETTGGE